MSVDPDRPAWTANFFVGVPAPAGAIIVLLPIYAAFLGLPRSQFVTWAMLVYTLAIAGLMVSRLPVFSGNASARACRQKWSGQRSFLSSCVLRC